MAETYIPLTESNKKLILNFIGMCRLNGIELTGEPSMSFKERRENVGKIIFDLFFRKDQTQEPCWSMTVRVDTDIRFHDEIAGKPGEMYCYLDSYKIEQGSLELQPVASKFNVFRF